MKKLLSLILCLILCLSLFACNSEAEQTTKDTNKAQQTEGTKGTQPTQSTDNSSKEENAENSQSGFIDTFIEDVGITSINIGYFGENSIIEYLMPEKKNSIKKTVSYLNGDYMYGFNLKLKEFTSAPVSPTAILFTVKYSNGNVVNLVGIDNYIGKMEKDLSYTWYEMIGDSILMPKAFFEDRLAEENTFKHPTTGELTAFEKIETSFIDGKIDMSNKKLICAVLEDTNSFRLQIEKSKTLDRIKNAFEEIPISDTWPDGFSYMAGNHYYHAYLYFDDGTYIFFGISNEYLVTNKTEYYPESEEQITALLNTFSWP